MSDSINAVEATQATGQVITTAITDEHLDDVSAGRSIFDPIVEFGQLWAEIGRGILALPKEIGRSLHPKL